jgi:xanthine dehydrogenase accessory factor
MNEKGIPMKEFYELIGNIPMYNENIIVKVIDGRYAGETAIFSGGNMIYSSLNNEFFHDMSYDMIRTGSCQVHHIDGQSIFCEVLGNEKKLVICGGGHVSIPIIKMAKILSFTVTVVEDLAYIQK